MTTHVNTNETPFFMNKLVLSLETLDCIYEKEKLLSCIEHAKRKICQLTQLLIWQNARETLAGLKP